MINILPYAQKKIIERIRVIRVLTVLVAVLMLLSVVGALLFLPTLFTINSRYAIARQGIATLEESGAVANPLDVRLLQTRIHTLSTKLAAPTTLSAVDKIAKVRALAPQGIMLSGFSFSSGALDVTGTASTRNALQAFTTALQGQEDVASLDSPISNFVKSTNSEFHITLTYKP